MATSGDVEELKARLTAERAKLLGAVANVPEGVMLKPFGDSGWSIRDILAHVAMAESVNVRFAKMMVIKEGTVQLREFAREFPDFQGDFELDKFNAWMAERWRAKSIGQVLTALEETRSETLAWLETLSSAQLECAGEHAIWGKQSVRGMFRILIIHDKFHRGDIEKRKQ